MHRLTISLEPAAHQIIQQRANVNRRSLSREISHLIEQALATEADLDVEDFRRLCSMMMEPDLSEQSLQDPAAR